LEAARQRKRTLSNEGPDLQKLVEESNRKKTLLVLISKASGNQQQVANQDRAMTMLQSQRIEPDILDGADPNHKDRRNELFGIIGMRGNYSQFFVVENGKTSFLGDFDVIEGVNESGSLKTTILGDTSAVETTSRSVPLLQPENNSIDTGIIEITLLALISKMAGD
jgi:hypothetical protein